MKQITHTRHWSSNQAPQPTNCLTLPAAAAVVASSMPPPHLHLCAPYPPPPPSSQTHDAQPTSSITPITTGVGLAFGGPNIMPQCYGQPVGCMTSPIPPCLLLQQWSPPPCGRLRLTYMRPASRGRPHPPHSRPPVIDNLSISRPHLSCCCSSGRPLYVASSSAPPPPTYTPCRPQLPPPPSR